jgi:ribonuclease BN (tRNA processing enzyme)
MKLTILGSGTVVPDARRNSAGYFIETPDVRLMMDCGAGTVHALARYRLAWERMTHLYISHFHVDHVGELASLFFAFKHALREKRDEPLTLIGPRGLEKVMGGLKQAFGDDLFEPKFPLHLRMLSPGEHIEIGGGRLAVAKTPHTDESLAVRIEIDGRGICYTGDTDYSRDVARFFGGASLMISECSFRERREGVPHVSVGDVARMASEARVERLVVTHFYFEFEEEELKRELESGFSGQVIIGRDGLQIEV